jgi:hypothetical protein
VQRAAYGAQRSDDVGAGSGGCYEVMQLAEQLLEDAREKLRREHAAVPSDLGDEGQALQRQQTRQ